MAVNTNYKGIQQKRTNSNEHKNKIVRISKTKTTRNQMLQPHRRWPAN